MKPHFDRGGVTLWNGDCRAVLPDLDAGSVNCCVTSPPYFGLRDYGNAAQIGLEPTPDAFVAELVAVFREVRRVLRDDGTLWLNLGDSYAGSWGNQGRKEGRGSQRAVNGPMMQRVGSATHSPACDLDEDCSCGASVAGIYPQKTGTGSWVKDHPTLKPKDLIGIPWRVAFALQADGWYLRQDIIWHKPNPMPESVTDRCTKAHEYLFLLSKSERYYFDAEAITEPAVSTHGSGNGFVGRQGGAAHQVCSGGVGTVESWTPTETRNRRSVWTIPTEPYRGAHFAVFPPDLVKPCVLAGCPDGGLVLDPFAGSGTTAFVARDAGRRFVGCELNAAYCALFADRLAQEVLPFGAAAVRA